MPVTAKTFEKGTYRKQTPERSMRNAKKKKEFTVLFRESAVIM